MTRNEISENLYYLKININPMDKKIDLIKFSDEEYENFILEIKHTNYCFLSF